MRLERVPRPNPGRGEVLLKVEAAGVGPWDGWIRGGKSAVQQPLPLTLGSDLSGEIVVVGPGVLTCVWEVRFMVLGIPDLSGPTPSMLWLPQRWSREGQPRAFTGRQETSELMRFSWPVARACEPSRPQARTISPFYATSTQTRCLTSKPSALRKRFGARTRSLIWSAAKHKRVRFRPESSCHSFRSLCC